MLSRRLFASCVLCAATGLVATGGDAAAQATTGVVRTILRREEFPGDKYATIQVKAEVEAGATVARHTHPGVESAYVVEGEGDLSVAGQPDRALKPLDGFQIPAEVPHSLRAGGRKMLLLITYVVEKDKPLATPAPG